MAQLHPAGPQTGDFDFSGADLRGISALDNAWINCFNHRANFTNCTFSDFTVSEIVFGQGADFSGSTFHGRAQFSFHNSIQAGPVTVSRAHFKEPVYAALFVGIGCLEGRGDAVHFAVLALGNAFPFVGALKALQMDAAMVGLSSAAISAIAVMSVMQNVTSTVLLFLIALGIRNRLR